VILFEESMDTRIIITDIAGRVIYQSKYSENQIEIDLSDAVADGTYFLTILSAENEHILTEKIQVLR